ncbi:rRNA-processing protein EFG1 [Bienertia sinuspersici]
MLCQNADDHKVDLASLHMIGKAESWVSSYLTVKRNVELDDFIIDVMALFKDEKGLNMVEQLIRCQQTGSLEHYIDDFESLKAILL